VFDFTKNPKCTTTYLVIMVDSSAALRLKGRAISASGPPVSSDIRFQLLDFQSIALDLHLIKPDLCTRCMVAAIQCQTVAVLVQLEFLPMQPLLIRAEIRHGACLGKTKLTYGER
jgi:hypothetical protein